MRLHPDNQRLDLHQSNAIKTIQHVFQHGAIIGHGRARGVMLGEIMGGGKTVTTICQVNCTPSINRILVACPDGAVESVWIRHLSGDTNPNNPCPAWSTRDLPVIPIHTVNEYDIPRIRRGWVIMNYSQIAKHAEALRKLSWDLIVLDESQRLKTWNSQRTMVVTGGNVSDMAIGPRRTWLRRRYETITPLASPHTKILALTGTPFVNRLEEMFPVLNLLDPVSYPNLRAFVSPWFNADHEEFFIDEDDHRVSGTMLYSELASLRQKLHSTVSIRRPPSILRQGLPDLTARIVHLWPTEADGDVSGIDTMDGEVEQQGNRHIEHMNLGVRSTTEVQEWFVAKELRLKILLSKLRGRLDREERRGLKSELNNVLSLMRERTGAWKTELALKYFATCCHDKTVVFGWHRNHMLNMAARLRREGHDVMTYLGGTREPDEVIEQFQTDSKIKFFFGNLDCASTAISLHAANKVVLFEQSWAPSDEDQSIARVWRKKQERPVRAIKFALTNSLDDRMLRTLYRKREGINAVLDGDEDMLI